MSKSLNARCIRRWKVRFKNICDSKINPWWRKRDLQYIRECALITADCMVESLAEDAAKVDYGMVGWSHEFSQWFHEQREFYLSEARERLNSTVTNDEIDEEIQNELEAWND
ncbi:hypothetical protein [Yokenella regensburgei]|uniref:hypothetical protein n=1 Tax=Yokenella regensburgei TaxID=158877 RepID=UPI001433266B|nr:hypothetical protein [Yokenella regensburgei]QIU88245.1 hypothetical protein HEC60_02095 [Yokenella regensburgei]